MLQENKAEFPSYVKDMNGTLFFQNVTENDKGNYTCIANNTQGTIIATVTITTVVAPQFVVKPIGPIQVNELSSVMIHCMATGDPKPTLQWDKNFVLLSVNNTVPNRITLLENGTLYFNEVHLDDEGNYGCTIGSLAGLKREEAKLIVRSMLSFVFYYSMSLLNNKYFFHFLCFTGMDELNNEDSEEDGFFVVRAILITVSVVFAYIILVVGLMIWCKIRRKARKNRMQLLNKENMDTFTGNDVHGNDENEPCLPDHKITKNNIVPNKTPIANGNGHVPKSDEPLNGTNSKLAKKSSLDQITIPRTIFADITNIGRGDFGTVSISKVKRNDLTQYLDKEVLASLKEMNNVDNKSNTSLEDADEILEEKQNNTETMFVLLKALNKVKDENICIEFRRQMDMFRAVSHVNVVKLLGLCRDKDPHLLVLEHTDDSDLKQYILNHCKSTTKNNMKIEQLLTFSLQIARGMDAIYRARYIHKDLATRNCIINSDLIVKVSYPAIQKENYSHEYYKHKNITVPLRWMAPECFEEDDNTIKSDVYAFGVVMWELFTYCSILPHSNLSNDEFLTKLQNNTIEWTMPDNFPDEIRENIVSTSKFSKYL